MDLQNRPGLWEQDLGIDLTRLNIIVSGMGDECNRMECHAQKSIIEMVEVSTGIAQESNGSISLKICISLKVLILLHSEAPVLIEWPE